MEEVLMLQPQNHIFHLRYAEILYTQDNIQLALKQFCRVVELCKDHVRGLYGMKLVSVSYLFFSSLSSLLIYTLLRQPEETAAIDGW